MPAAAARKPATRKPAARKPATRKAPTRDQRNARALERARNGHAKPRARTAPATHRRKSGAVARPATRSAPRPKAAPRTTARPVARPIARVAQGSASVLLDQLVRGRTWVGFIGVLLAGIVFLNVSVLETNRGIARTDAKAAELERTNSTMREKVAALGSPERIQELAEARGYVLPLPGDVTYIKPNRHRDAKLASHRIEPPGGETVLATAAPPAAQPPAPEPTATTPQSATPPSAIPPEPVAATAPVATP
jgi:hypothetical protein